MSTINFYFAGPGTTIFFAAAVAIYSSVLLKDRPVLCWVAISFGLVAIVAGLAVEYADRIIKQEAGNHRTALSVLLIVAAFVMIGAILSAFQAFTLLGHP